MLVHFLPCFLGILLSVSAADEIRWSLDANGKKLFYNIPSTIKKTTASGFVPGTESQPFIFSNRMKTYEPIIEKACSLHGVDAALVKAVIQIESGYDSSAVSRAGATGLMQLMPATAARFGVRTILDPAENIEGGVKYLKFLVHLFQNDLILAVAAYNAGEDAVQRYNGIPEYAETQDYVRKVISVYRQNTGDNPWTRTKNAARPKPVRIYYKLVDEKGITHYTTTPQPQAEMMRLVS